METSKPQLQENSAPQFETLAREGGSGFMSELWGMLKQNKKWWLTPIIIVLVVVTVLIILGSTAAAPFIYTLF